MSLEDFGYNDWFRAELRAHQTDESHVARITAVDRDRYLIGSRFGSISAEPAGALSYGAAVPEDMPCVGDWVLVDCHDNNTHAIVYGILPRKSILRRRSAGARVSYQPIAANIDVAFIVQSCDVDYNLNRLDRYTVMTKDGGIDSVLLLTKLDLIDEPRIEAMIADVKRHHGIDVIPVSSTTGAGYDRLRRTIERGKTYCLIGSSGVGKSTIVNCLLGKSEIVTNSVRAGSGKGRHTTTRRQLISLESGALLIDTPGMRELGMMGFGLGLEEGFDDISAIARGCRFADCSHSTEIGCAVLASVARGELPVERYQSYQKLKGESEHYEMSYLERRKKDKAFGKLIKNYKRYNKKQ